MLAQSVPLFEDDRSFFRIMPRVQLSSFGRLRKRFFVREEYREVY